MIGGAYRDLAAVLLLHGRDPLSDVLARHPDDLEVLDEVAARAEELWVERVRALLHEHAVDVANHIGQVFG